MSLFRFSFAALLFAISTTVHAVLGLCPTPAGPVGLVPCDTACTGSAFVVGSMQLNATYSQYIQTLTRATSTVTQCTITTSSIEARTKAKLKSVSASLSTLLKLALKREINQVDGITLKFGVVFSNATTTMRAVILEFIKEITARTESFVSLISLEYKNELPSGLAPKIISAYSLGLESTNARLMSIFRERETLRVKENAYIRLIETSGKATSASEALVKVKKQKAISVFNTAAEYFSPPAFTPHNYPLFTYADLKLSILLARNESNCWVNQSITNTSRFSCTSYEQQLSNEDLISKLKDTQQIQSKAVADSFEEVSKDAFKQKDQMASSECMNGILGLNFEANLISLENLSYFESLKALKEYASKTGCAAMVSYFNNKIATINSEINMLGSEISTQTGGLVDISSSKTNGIFSADGKITDIMESELGDEFSDEINAKVNKNFFGKEKPLNGSNYVDLTDSRYRSSGRKDQENVQSTLEGASINRKAIEEKVDETVCQVFGC